MSAADRYIHQVKSHLFATPEEIHRFTSDLGAHFAEAAARNESPAQVIERMGSAETVAAAFNAERPLYYAGFWQRLVAFLGDLGALACLHLPALGILLWLFPLGQPDAAPAAWHVAVLGLFALGILGTILLYFPILEGRFGSTVGKHILRLRVLQESAAPITMPQAFLRRLSFYFKLIALDALFIPFTAKRQRALDIVARTVVVREPGDAASWWRYGLCLLLLVAPLALFGAAACLLSGA